VHGRAIRANRSCLVTKCGLTSLDGERSWLRGGLRWPLVMLLYLDLERYQGKGGKGRTLGSGFKAPTVSAYPLAMHLIRTQSTSPAGGRALTMRLASWEALVYHSEAASFLSLSSVG
jgi:hypothetical protein